MGNQAGFRILGPFEALRGSSVVELSGTRKALVAALLLRANEPVTIESLIDDLWGTTPPPTAPRMIRNAVSALRRQLPAGTLVTRPGGYELVVEPERIDAVRFEQLAAAGRDALGAGDPAEAVARLGEALALWHGRPLADFAYSQFAHAAIARLEELRVAALEDRIEAELQLGRDADLVGDLEALVREQPLRERPRAQLMLALYRSGRQAEALAAYQQARKLLADELGLEPSPTLRGLEQSILRHDPALQPERPAAPAARRRPLPETRRELVVLSVLFLPAAEVVDAEARRAVLADARAAATLVLERHGAVVEPLHTGALMGVFGVPAAHEDDSLRALRAAVELRAAGDASGTGLQVGVDSGPAIVRETDAGGLAVDGEVVASASRLALAAEPAETLVGRGAERLVRGAARLEADGEAWRLVQIVPGATAILRRFDTELVGRGRELDALNAHFERCMSERATQLFAVLGAPGIGKSKLAREFAAAVGDDARVLQGQCLPYGDGVTFWPLREIVRSALGDDDAASIESVFDDTPEDVVAAGRIAAAIGAGDAVAGSREETFRAVRGMLEALAAERPLVLVLEDVHWAEPTFLDLVDHVVDLARTSPIFVLCLARPELLERRPLWAGGRPNVASILLEPLGDEDAQHLIDNLLAGRPLDPIVRARILESAEGNALFLEQILALLAEEGHAAAVPPTLQALLASRVDRLPIPERALLERAAVVGRSFSIDAVRDLTPETERSETELVLEQLVRRGLVEPDRSAHDEDLRFVHGLIRDVVYESVPKRTRAALHERCAERLDSDELVGHHLEQAHRNRTELGVESSNLAARASERLARAGRSAYLGGDAPAAAGLLGRAVRLAEADAFDRPSLLAELADALRESGDFRQATEAVAELETVAESRGDPVLQALALVCRHRLVLMTGAFDVEPLEREAIAATEIFARAGDERLLAKVWELRAVEAWFSCRAGTAEHALARAIEYARRAGDERTEAQSMGLSIGAAVFGPLPVDEGLARCEEILARPQARRRIVAAALRASAALGAMQGEFDAARERLANSRELLEDLGLVLAAAQATETAGTVELLAGDPVAAEVELRSGYQRLDRMGDTSMRANLTALLAQALSEQDRHGEALVLTEVAEQTASPGDLSAQVHWRSSRTRALVGLGRMAEAERFGLHAVELADRTDFLNVRADALLAYADAAPNRSDGIAAVAAAVDLYERKGNIVSADAARSIASSERSWSATR